MSEETDVRDTKSELESKPPIGAQIQPALDLKEPACGGARDNDDSTAELAREIRGGEKWLIGIGIATLLINCAIALIYWGQLKEMRVATDAATKAAKAAESSLQEMKTGSGATDTHTLAQQAVNQAANTADLVKIAKTQADVAADTLRRSQRPWVNAESFEVKRIVLPPRGRFNIYGVLTMKNTGTSVANEGWAEMVALSNNAAVLSKKWDAACKLMDTQMAASHESAKRGLGDTWPIGFVLAPDQETNSMGFGMGGDFTQIDIFQGFYLSGCAKYTDQFKRLHTTMFCFIPDRPVYREDGSINDFKFQVCNGFQRAD